MPVTGRWPVAVADWGNGIEDLVNRHGVIAGEDRWPAAMMQRLPEVDVEGLLDRTEREAVPVQLARDYEWHRATTAALCGEAPSLETVLAALGDVCSEMDLERWMLAWERQHCPDARPVEPATYLDWFEPDSVELLLLPRAEPWAAACYLESYESDWPHPDLRPALFRRWHLEHGAEPVANWGTMQQLVVRRPPADLAAAWEVARAQVLLWADTGARSGVTARHLARDLVGRDRWFLHLRP